LHPFKSCERCVLADACRHCYFILSTSDDMRSAQRLRALNGESLTIGVDRHLQAWHHTSETANPLLRWALVLQIDWADDDLPAFHGCHRHGARPCVSQQEPVCLPPASTSSRRVLAEQSDGQLQRGAGGLPWRAAHHISSIIPYCTQSWCRLRRAHHRASLTPIYQCKDGKTGTNDIISIVGIVSSPSEILCTRQSVSWQVPYGLSLSRWTAWPLPPSPEVWSRDLNVPDSPSLLSSRDTRIPCISPVCGYMLHRRCIKRGGVLCRLDRKRGAFHSQGICWFACRCWVPHLFATWHLFFNCLFVFPSRGSSLPWWAWLSAAFVVSGHAVKQKLGKSISPIVKPLIGWYKHTYAACE